MSSVLFAEMASAFTNDMRGHLDAFERELRVLEADLGDVFALERARDAVWSMKDAAAALVVRAEEEDVARRLKAVSTLARVVEVRIAEVIRKSRSLDSGLLEQMHRVIPTIYAIVDSNLNFGGEEILRLIEDLHASPDANSTRGGGQSLTQDDLNALFDADVRARTIDIDVEPPTEPPELPLRRSQHRRTESRNDSDAAGKPYGDPILDVIAFIIGERAEQSRSISDALDDADDLTDFIGLESSSVEGKDADSSTSTESPFTQEVTDSDLPDGNDAFREVFLGEACETLEELGRDIVALEQDTRDTTTVNNALRLAHTLKGSAAMLGYERIRALSHAMEDALQAVRDCGAALTTEITDLLFGSLDVLGKLVTEIDERGVEPQEDDTHEYIQRLRVFASRSSTQTDAVQTEKKRPVAIVEVLGADSCSETERHEEVVVDEHVEMSDIVPEDFPRWSHTLQNVLVRSLVALEIDASSVGERRRFTSAAQQLAHGADISGFDKVATLASELHHVTDDADDQESIPRSILDALAAGVETLEAMLVRVRRDGHDRDPAIDDVVSLLADVCARESNAVSGDPSNGDDTNKDDRRGRSRTVEVDLDRLNRLLSLAAELVISRNRLSTELDSLAETVVHSENQHAPYESVSRIGVIAKDLHDEILRVRMVRVERAFDRIPRTLRDAAHSANKKVNLILEGVDTEIDKNILEAMNNPLLHLIRNTVGHGIETPEERVTAGKSSTGEVRVKAEQDGNRIIVEVSDDGRGIDPDQFRTIAVQRELLTSDQAQSLTDNEAIDLIFRPGFTTVEAVNELSGRGVGLDVVRSVATRFNGSVSVESVVGRGTTFRVTLPLTLAIGQALLVVVSGSVFALPISLVQRIVRVSDADTEKRNSIRYYWDSKERFPVVSLAEVLRLRGDDEREGGESETLVIVKEGGLVGALGVDRVIGREDIVIKTLGRHLRRVHGISGATVLGDGSIALILNVHDLLTPIAGDSYSDTEPNGASTFSESVKRTDVN